MMVKYFNNLVCITALVLCSNASFARVDSVDLDSLVVKAQELVYSNPKKVDSVISIIENRTLVQGDSFYYVVTTSLRGIKASMQNDYGPALKYFYDVWQFAKREGDTATQVGALSNMAGVCQLSGRYADAKRRLVTALALNDPRENPSLHARFTMALGMAEVELGQKDSAERHLRYAVDLFDEMKDEHSVLACMSELGYLLESNSRYRDALDIYKRMDVLYQFTEDVTGEIVANQRKGNTLMHLGRMRDAVDALEYSLALADSMDYENQKDTTLLRLVKANAALGDIDGAEKYTKQLVAFIQNREKKKNRELIAFVEAKYNLEQKALANESLVAELRNTREALGRNQLYLKFAIAAIVVLFLSLVVVFRRLTSFSRG